MGTCGRLATQMDAEMLRRNGAKAIYDWFSWDRIIGDQGALGIDPTKELDGRYLVRYLRRRQQGLFLRGAAGPVFVTPTAYSPDEVVSWLALPFPTDRVDLALLLDPRELGYRPSGPLFRVYGPRWVPFGGGIEYLLFDGFPEAAIVPVAVGIGGGVGRWELEVK